MLFDGSRRDGKEVQPAKADANKWGGGGSNFLKISVTKNHYNSTSVRNINT